MLRKVIWTWRIAATLAAIALPVLGMMSCEARDAFDLGGKPFHCPGWTAPLAFWAELGLTIIFTGGLFLLPYSLVVMLIVWLGTIVIRRVAYAAGEG